MDGVGGIRSARPPGGRTMQEQLSRTGVRVERYKCRWPGRVEIDLDSLFNVQTPISKYLCLSLVQDEGSRGLRRAMARVNVPHSETRHTGLDRSVGSPASILQVTKQN